MPLYKGDMRAAFTGLVVGGVAIFALMFGIVKLTNAMYADHAPAQATQAQPGAPAPAGGQTAPAATH